MQRAYPRRNHCLDFLWNNWIHVSEDRLFGFISSLTFLSFSGHQKFWLVRDTEKLSTGGVWERWCTICWQAILRSALRTAKRLLKLSSRGNSTFQPTWHQTLAIWFADWWSDKCSSVWEAVPVMAWKFVRIRSSRTSIGKMSSSEDSSHQSNRFW